MINITIKNLEDVRVALIFRLLSFEGSVNVVCLTKLARYSLFLNPSRSNVFLLKSVSMVYVLQVEVLS